MARRRRAVKRPVQPDSKYQNKLVAILVNTVMKQGKKSLAQRIVYQAIDRIAEKNPDTDPLEVLKRAVDNAKLRMAAITSLPVPAGTACAEHRNGMRRAPLLLE